MQVVVNYRVPRTYLMRSPLKKHSVKRLVRGSYRMVMSEFTSLESNPGDLDWHAGSDTI